LVDAGHAFGQCIQLVALRAVEGRRR